MELPESLFPEDVWWGRGEEEPPTEAPPRQGVEGAQLKPLPCPPADPVPPRGKTGRLQGHLFLGQGTARL